MTYHSFKMPNQIIMDSTLSLSARKIAAYLYAYRRGKICSKSYRDIARKARCATNTVRSAVDELQSAGYLTITKTHRWDKKLCRVVNDVNVYTLSSVHSKYTLIPFSLLFDADLTAAELSISLYLFCAAGPKASAYPSIQHISERVGVAKSTVCKALAAIRQLVSFLVMRCRTVFGDFGCNTYFLISFIRKAAKRLFRGNTGSTAQLPVFTGHRVLSWLLHHIHRPLQRLFYFFSRGSPKFDT